jgi:hypothetical protein
VKIYAQRRDVYFSDVPDETWPKGVDVRPTKQPAGPASKSSTSSENMEEYFGALFPVGDLQYHKTAHSHRPMPYFFKEGIFVTHFAEQ